MHRAFGEAWPGNKRRRNVADVLPLDDATVSVAAGFEPALSALKYPLPAPPAQLKQLHGY